MVFSKAKALQLCALNEAAYDLATTGHCKLPNGFSSPAPIRMPPGDRPFFLRGDPLDIWGYVSTHGGTAYVVFRGTQFTSGLGFGQEWCEDALSLPLEPLGAGRVHLGFYGAWRALREVVISLTGTGPRVVTGHSLGAAIATLCWADLGGDLMTFASPRVGDPAFATALWKGQTVRMINAPDIVPNVPTDPPFRHGGFEQKVYGPGSLLDRKLAHALQSYSIGLTALPDEPGS
ncbi:MAG: lipase family protein [Acidobacteriota bacterium]|nr:lipase family protein [Acidobacteriota bacterium]